MKIIESTSVLCLNFEKNNKYRNKDKKKQTKGPLEPNETREKQPIIITGIERTLK